MNRTHPMRTGKEAASKAIWLLFTYLLQDNLSLLPRVHTYSLTAVVHSADGRLKRHGRQQLQHCPPLTSVTTTRRRRPASSVHQGRQRRIPREPEPPQRADRRRAGDRGRHRHHLAPAACSGLACCRPATARGRSVERPAVIRRNRCILTTRGSAGDGFPTTKRETDQ